MDSGTGIPGPAPTISVVIRRLQFMDILAGMLLRLAGCSGKLMLLDWVCLLLDHRFVSSDG